MSAKYGKLLITHFYIFTVRLLITHSYSNLLDNVGMSDQ